MTDLSHHAYPASSVPARTASRADAVHPSPLLPWICAFVAGAAGLYAGRAMGGAEAGYEDKLLLLLRFMAVMKFAGVLLAAALIHWRFRTPVALPLAATYLSAVTVMAAAAGLIWSLGGIVLGAVLFHAGLLVFLVLAWKDEGVSLPMRRPG